MSPYKYVLTKRKNGRFVPETPRKQTDTERPTSRVSSGREGEVRGPKGHTYTLPAYRCAGSIVEQRSVCGPGDGSVCHALARTRAKRCLLVGGIGRRRVLTLRPT